MQSEPPADSGTAAVHVEGGTGAIPLEGGAVLYRAAGSLAEVTLNRP